MLLMIHGISQQKYIGREDKLRDKWISLLREGLSEQGASGQESSEIIDSSRMLFYADLTDPDKVHAPADTRAVGIAQYESIIRQQLEADDRSIHNWPITHG